MRTITDHKLNGLNEAIEIRAVDEPGPGGANHNYSVVLSPPGRPSFHIGQFVFQNGPIATPADMNGLTVEVLIAIAIDRMRGFQGQNPKPAGWGKTVGDAATQVAAMHREDEWGKFRCRENAVALTHLGGALMWLQKRTRDRLARGVEGTNKV
jgi:hypothetical protein